MKVSDYIVEYLINREITDVFGYPGGMVTHLMDSFSKYPSKISAHVTYHEQGAAFAACGYAQASGKTGVAYATSGPGATNLITGICNAYFDSIPVLFITGQVNTFESRGSMPVRQRGFQETDIVSMVSGVTKYAAQITEAARIKWYFDYAFAQAREGRKGPVLLDIPMDILRADIDPDKLYGYAGLPQGENSISEADEGQLKRELLKAERPVLLLGNGVKSAGAVELAREAVRAVGIPTVSTMIAVDVVADRSLNYGFIGAYGSRVGNFLIAKSDLVIVLGARLDVRQVGAKRENFAPNATIIRVDIDAGELAYRIREDEIQICADIRNVLNILIKNGKQYGVDYSEWLHICDELRNKLGGIDDRSPNILVEGISRYLPEDAVITTDVGQNQVWAAQSLRIKENQRIFFSGGHGAMGYSLPASIGACMASGKTVFSFNGDGGIQMNLQELQTIVREKLPIKIILFNNFALGMIRHFQEMYFQENYFQTVSQNGYTVPDFGAIAKAYGMDYRLVSKAEDICKELFAGNAPAFIEVRLAEDTYVFPKLEFGKANHDQEPLLDRELFDYLNSL